MRPEPKAFTLIELVIVLAIIGIVAGVAAPYLAGAALSRNRLSRDANRLAAVARQARNLAVCTARQRVLHLDGRTGEYWVTAAETGSPAGREAETTEDESTLLNGRLSEGVRFTALGGANRDAGCQTASFRFSPQGWADVATIRLMDGNGQGRTLTITPLLGVTEVTE
jgi:type II secretion system protein H